MEITLLLLSNLALVILVLLLFREHRRTEREKARSQMRYDALIRELSDRLMHLAGRTWQIPPVLTEEINSEAEVDEAQRLREIEGWAEL